MVLIYLSALSYENAARISKNDPVTWVILGALFIISFFTVSIAVERFLLFRKATSLNNSFETTFGNIKTKEMMGNLTIVGDPAPFARIFIGLHNRLFFTPNPEAPVPAKPKLEEIKMLSEKLVREEMHRLEGKITFLATTTTVAPFFGLLGTVWGIMLSFMAMGQHKSTDISAIGPGVAAALVTTIVGLLVAIPAVMLYNGLNSKLRSMVVSMENFSDEIIEKSLVWGMIS
ncbi:MotA/TolQ/ExbB proton channel family protein [candidate division WOR-3 bacterium]|nr:MotA/TolQ/ExbB proton channel family protein [candidate division WOR-3 bacterium]